jgi:hypothetical protein
LSSNQEISQAPGGGGRLEFIEWIGWNIGQGNSQYTQKEIKQSNNLCHPQLIFTVTKA